MSAELITYVITPSFVIQPTPTWGATGNAVLHHAEGITMKIEVESATTCAIVEIAQGATHHLRIATAGVTTSTTRIVDGEAETEARTGVATRGLAEKRVKSAL